MRAFIVLVFMIVFLKLGTSLWEEEVPMTKVDEPNIIMIEPLIEVLEVIEDESDINTEVIEYNSFDYNNYSEMIEEERLSLYENTRDFLNN